MFSGLSSCVWKQIVSRSCFSVEDEEIRVRDHTALDSGIDRAPIFFPLDPHTAGILPVSGMGLCYFM